MTDRQKGIVRASIEIFPNDKSKYCARHIFANFKCRYPGVKVRKLV